MRPQGATFYYWRVECPTTLCFGETLFACFEFSRGGCTSFAFHLRRFNFSSEELVPKVHFTKRPHFWLQVQNGLIHVYFIVLHPFGRCMSNLLARRQLNAAPLYFSFLVENILDELCIKWHVFVFCQFFECSMVASCIRLLFSPLH